MAQDQQEEAKASRPSGPGRVVVAGIVVAMTLGAGLGLWARPAAAPEPEPKIAAPEAPPPIGLQIVVEDTPPPIGQPLEVLPADLAAAAEATLAARGPRVVKVEAPTAAKPLPVVTLRQDAPAKTEAKRKPSTRKAEPNAKAPKVQMADAGPKAAKKAKSAKASKSAAAAKSKKDPKLAKATAKASEKAKPASPKPSVQLAEAKPPKTRPAKPSRKAEKPPVRLAKASPAKKPPTRPPPRGEGPLRVARNDCAMPDPGAALVCADRRLGARDQQLQRAYRRAEAAGVPASALHRQQTRWLAVRAAAAREAPWAVEDVYVARISEINDMIRDAREN